jgi:hypothetical protein
VTIEQIIEACKDSDKVEVNPLLKQVRRRENKKLPELIKKTNKKLKTESSSEHPANNN